MATLSEREKWKVIQRHVGSGVDGWPGDETATDVLEYLRKTGGDCTTGPEPDTPPIITPPPIDLDPPPTDTVVRFPIQTERNMLATFGTPGTGMVSLKTPYELRISWDLRKRLNAFSIHALCHDSYKAIMEDTLEHYGAAKIRELGLDRWGGCVSVRKKRGGSTWSQHAAGAAVDWWPEQNWLTWDAERAEFAKDIYKAFFDIHEAHGWSSLGRHADYDWMHVQAMPFK